MMCAFVVAFAIALAMPPKIELPPDESPTLFVHPPPMNDNGLLLKMRLLNPPTITDLSAPLPIRFFWPPPIKDLTEGELSPITFPSPPTIADLLEIPTIPLS